MPAKERAALTTFSRFDLFVAGDSPRGQTARANLERLCRAALGDSFEIEIIDVLERPELAEGDSVVATPTLIRREPAPVRRLVGDLSDDEKVISALDLQPGAGSRE